MNRVQHSAEQASRCPTCNAGWLRDKAVTEDFEFEVDGKTKPVVAENVLLSECDNGSAAACCKTGRWTIFCAWWNEVRKTFASCRSGRIASQPRLRRRSELVRSQERQARWSGRRLL